MAQEEVPQPEQPPRVERKFQLYPTQWIGVPILMVLPLLAVFDVFGQSFQSQVIVERGLSMLVEYPTATRYRLTETIKVVVSNEGTQPKAVSLHFSAGYLESFTSVTLTPSPSEVVEDAVVVPLGVIRPGTSNQLLAELQSNAYGKRKGWVQLVTDEGDDPRIDFETLTYP